VNDLDALLAGIRANPEDDVARLAYADRLQELEALVPCGDCGPSTSRGRLRELAGSLADEIAETERDPKPSYQHDGQSLGWADYRRLLFGLSTSAHESLAKMGKCPRCRDTGTVSNGNEARAEFIRVQCELANRPLASHPTHCDECASTAALRRRERELWSQVPLPEWVSRDVSVRDWERGFLWSVRCSWSDWLGHYDAILAHPGVVLVRAEFTTRVPCSVGGPHGNGYGPALPRPLPLRGGGRPGVVPPD
jgi:hypothetical protein